MGEIFGTHHGSNSVFVISDVTNSVIATIPISAGTQSYGLAYDSDLGEIFVTNGENTVSIISDKTNTVIATVPLSVDGGVHLWEIAYDSAKRELFAANFISDVIGGKGFLINTVLVISDSTTSPTSAPTLSPTSTPIPTVAPTPIPTPEPEPFPTLLVVASVITVAVVGIGLLVYFKKRKH
jgi:YVTN family beta-propeller protein